jgi:hypothetical protein
MTDVVFNKDRKFGSADSYVHTFVQSEDGNIVPALFTPTEISKGVKRAAENKEDVKDFKEPSTWSYFKYKVKKFFKLYFVY